ncbi:MAG: aldehyde dehydrogenase family protein [Pseudomonadota bacterium]
MNLFANVIGGKPLAGGGPGRVRHNPMTGDGVASWREADAADVAAAVSAARTAFEAGDWSGAPVATRQAALRAMAAAIRTAAGDLAALQTAETGITIKTATRHVAGGAAWFDYFADALATDGGAVHSQLPGATTLIVREPLGVCALFAPWNVPVGLAAIKIAPALAAGNAAVWKASEETPATARALYDCLAPHVPPGILNLINGAGAVTGAALAEAPVDAISFTGGGAGGAAVMRAAAARAVPVTLELGGKSANIIFADADLEAAVAGSLAAAYGNNGEACLAGSRILVERPIFDAFVKAFEAGAAALTVGDPMAPDTDIGPMVSPAHHARVTAFFDHGAEDGDTLLFGGPGEGLFVRPSAFLAGTKGRVWLQEIFGPIAAIHPFDDEAEAIALANDTAYGLVAYLWTQNATRALSLPKRLRAGTVLLNTAMLRELNAPFGGVGLSGIGREGGRYSFENFSTAKAIVMRHT